MQSGVNAAGDMLAASVKVEFAGTAKSTWKRYSGHVPVLLEASHGFGLPAGGTIDPSRSPGRMKPMLEDIRPVVTKVAAVPASIAERSSAKGCGPR